MLSYLELRGLVAAALGVLTLATLACGGGSGASVTSASTVAATQATAGAASVVATAAIGSATADAEPVTAITLVATDNAYAPKAFRVRAGEQFTVTLENSGAALHDWRVRGVQDEAGRDLGTRLLQTGQSESISLTIERPGAYDFYCEVHPAEMRGKLMVE